MLGKTTGLLALLLLVGCGGGAAAGPSPETGGTTDEPAVADGEKTPSTAEPAASDSESSATKDETPASSESSAAATVGTLDGEDLQATLQAVLSDPELLDHLHLKKPGRAPLKVAGPNLPAKLKVTVGSHDVQVVEEPSSKKTPVLVLTKLEREGDQARIHYRFDVEGLKGRATLYLKNGRWELAANRVIEQ